MHKPSIHLLCLPLFYFPSLFTSVIPDCYGRCWDWEERVEGSDGDEHATVPEVLVVHDAREAEYRRLGL
jgi:hypothetical protein